MAILVLGLVLFLGVHSARIFADGWRTATIGSMGEKPWKGVYSLLSIAGFVVLVWGYGIARQNPVLLWSPPVAMRHVAALLMVIAFILFVAAYVPGNWFKATLHHPQMLSVKIWAFGHLIANGTLVDMVLFGAFLAWAVLGYTAARRRDRAAGTVYAPATAKGTAITVVVGLVAFAVFAFWLHGWLIGVRPFG
ncbi:MAG: NnrU family protein [Ramlibacter sp.]|nr:NnrU family protein [Ramlibacter sp.]